MTVKTRIDTSKLDTDFRVKKAIKAVQILEIIVNSDLFKQKILDMPEWYRKGEKSKFKDYLNAHIYQAITTGKEEWNGEVDYEIDLIIDDYRKWWSKVIGYMIPGKPTIYVNTKYFDYASVASVASNLLHEYGHTLGMRHGGEYFKQSITYYLNKAFSECYDVLIAGKNPEPVKYKKVCKRIWYMPWKKRCWLVRV